MENTALKFITKMFIIIFTVFLTFISIFGLFGYSILETTEDLLKEENIISTIKSIDIIDFVGKDNIEEIYSILEKAKIPTEYIDLMLEDEDLKEQIGKYAIKTIEYVTSLEDMPEIKEDEVSEFLITTFDKVIIEVENHNINVSTYITKEEQQKIHEEINHYVPEIIENIPEIEKLIEEKIYGSDEYKEIEKKKEQIEKVITIIKQIYEYKWLLLVLTIIPIGLIIIIKRKELKFIKWLSLPPLCVATILRIIIEIMPLIIDEMITEEKLKMIIAPSLELLSINMRNLSNLYFELGLAIIIIQIGVTIYKRTQKNGE